MKDFFASRSFKRILWIIGGLAVAFFVFGLGVAVGYRKALFSSSYGENYYHNFYGDGGEGPMQTHGVAGIVIDASTSSISLKDNDNNEQSVAIDADTVIKKMNDTIPVDMIRAGDMITVIGEPNDNGQIHARFVRVFGASSSMPLPPLPPPAP
jgi:hypothetical protein